MHPSTEDRRDQDRELTSSIAALSSLVTVGARLPQTLTSIAGFAVRAIPGADGAGLTLFQDARPQTVVASAPFVGQADALQYSIREGPCIAATSGARTVRSGSLDVDADYPVFGPQVAALGLHSMLSLPLLADHKVLGSINVYARSRHAFDDRAQELGELFALHATVAVQNAQVLSEAQRLATQLHSLLSTPASGAQPLPARAIADTEPTTSADRQPRFANATLDAFLPRISHELRTPLNSVLGFAQLLELEPLSASQHESVDHILRSGRQLLTMVEDVFDITAIEAGSLELSRQPVAIGEVVDDAIVEALQSATVRQVEISYHPCLLDPPPYIQADPARVRQVLLNLLSNAIKFNHIGGRVEVSCGVSDGLEISVAVTDTGSGIGVEDLPRLFTPFDRLGETSDIEGTGIGLPLSQRLVELMGGRLQVKSVRAQGSTFTVTFPVVASPAPVEPIEPVAAPTADQTLLYVEDNVENVQLMTSILRKSPRWTMIHAARGALGLELARSSRPGLILLARELPDLDAIEVLRDLKHNARTSDIPVVVLSADASQGQVRQLQDAGAQDYLIEPLDVGGVLKLLKTHARPGRGEQRRRGRRSQL